MKRLICVLLSLTVLLTLGFPAVALQTEEQQILSELTDEELVDFFVENGVKIPTQFPTNEACLSFARSAIEAVEQDSNARFHCGFKYLQDFSDAIIVAVNSYYGNYGISTCVEEYGPQSIVQDNVVLGTWDDDYRNYNCYAYAIGYSGWPAPGEIAWQMNGGTGYYASPVYDTANIAAELVVSDLTALGYTVTYSGPILSMASGTITVHSRLICVRMAASPYHDFHFMQKLEDGFWYQKYGRSTPMRYKYTPSMSLDWVPEGLDNRGYYRDNDKKYTGSIYFISYTKCKDTDWRYSSCGNDKHKETCSVCGLTRGQQIDCTYQYRYDGDDTHILACTGCGNTTGNTSRCIYRNNICKTCGHYKISGGIIQSVCLLKKQ